jgi:hypothetical protein
VRTSTVLLADVTVDDEHGAVTAACGNHDDWDDYDRVMRDERRTAVLVTPRPVCSNPN